MNTKQAAINSLYIIFLSQLTSLISTVITGTVPDFEAVALVLMVAGGITGALIGKKINKKLSNEGVNKLFITLMVVIIFINIYNTIRFLS